MPSRIAIPVPHSLDSEYAQRAMPQYERAVEMAGGVPVRIPLYGSAEEIARSFANCDGVLLPGSNADLDPIRFGGERSPRTAVADLRREEVDGLLLRDAYEHRKPVLGICYGLQSLNVFCGGSLIQHIPDFLPEQVRGRVNHDAGKKATVAHTVAIERGSRLAGLVGAHEALPVNSSHHQSAHSIGAGLRVVARCPDDEIIEAVEGIGADHFVVAVQWHPERSVDQDEASRAIFRALIEAAK